MSNQEQEYLQNENQEEGENINLSDNNLTDVNDVLLKFPNPELIISLDLSNNLLSFLPNDLSRFINLNTLNISKNRFVDYKRLAQSLATLPQLANLYLDLTTHEDALIILESLPNLQYLNGTGTQDNGEVDPNQQNEDIQETNNDIPELEQKITSEENDNLMNNKKSIEEIHYTTSQNEDEDNINGDFNQAEIEEVSLKEEIPNFNAVLQKVISFYKNQKDKKDKLYGEFQEFLKNQIEQLNNLIDSSVPNYIYSISVYQSKLEIYSFLKKKIFPLLHTQKIISNTSSLISALGDIEKFTYVANKQIYETSLKLHPKIESCILQLKDKIKSKNGIISEMNQKIKKIENDKEKEIQSKNSIISALEHENKNLNITISKLKSENEVLTNKIITKAKNILEIENQNFQNTTENVPIQTNPNNLYIKTVTSPSDLSSMVPAFSPKVISKKQLLEIINEIYKSKENSDKKNILNQLPKETMEQHMYNYLKSKYGLKNLIIEWATSIINGIKMYSKDDAEVCLFGKILRNELEENSIIVMKKMKTALTELIKYLLGENYPIKSYDEINSLCNYIKNNRMYLEENIWKNICVMLFQSNKNDLNNFVQKVENFIRNKINSQNEDFNKEMMFLNSKGRIRKEEKILMTQAKNECKILYKDLFQLLLDYQIKIRGKYLQNFVTLFREVDVDLNGVINDEQFKLLVKRCRLFENEEMFENNFEKLIETVDNYGNNVITFSDIVELFDKEIVDGGVCALEKIAMMS